MCQIARVHEHDRELVTTKFIYMYKFVRFHLKLYMYNDYFDVTNIFIHGDSVRSGKCRDFQPLEIDSLPLTIICKLLRVHVFTVLEHV